MAMQKFVLYLTVYNITILLTRLGFLVLDPTGAFLKWMQFYDIAVLVLFPLFILWSLLYLTIPTALYCAVNNAASQFNGYNFSTLTVNSLACLALIVFMFSFGFTY